MDYLINSIRNLSSKEEALLKQRIDRQNKKKNLLKYIKSENIESNEELGKVVSKRPSLTSLYTLKSRLLEDVISVKTQLRRNAVTETREMVQGLRKFLYSKDYEILIRQLRVLENKCKKYELYSELKEIYFCRILINRHDIKRSKKYYKLIEKYREKECLTNALEEKFYKQVLNSQDLFYHFNPKEYKRSKKELKELADIHFKIGGKGSQFIYLSGELSLHLNLLFDQSRAEEFYEKLELLRGVYKNLSVKDRYPNCEVAIQCLYSKYYYLTGDVAKFRQSQYEISEHLNVLQNNQMFNSSFLCFIYTEVLHLIKKNDVEGVVRFIEKHLGGNFQTNDLSLLPAFKYFIAIKEFYKGNYFKSTSVILSSRGYFKYLDNLSSWAAVESMMLHIINNFLMNDYKTMGADISALNRLFVKHEYNENVIEYFKNLYKIISNKSSDMYERVELLNNNIKEIQKDLLMLNILRIDKG